MMEVEQDQNCCSAVPDLTRSLDSRPVCCDSLYQKTLQDLTRSTPSYKRCGMAFPDLVITFPKWFYCGVARRWTG